MKHINRTVKALVKNNTKEVREARKLSKTRLAAMMNLNERTQRRYVGDLENQKVQPSVEKLAILCINMDCMPEELLRFDFTLVHEAIARLRKQITKAKK